MWILPRQLLLKFAPATEECVSDSKEQLAAVCTYSVLSRSKPLPSKSWLRVWNQGKFPRLQSGAISNPFAVSDFEDWWILSLRATHANRSRQPEDVKEPTIRATCGPMYDAQLSLFAPDTSSSKTSLATYRLDSPQCSQIWKKMATDARGDSLRRQKLALHTRGSECLCLENWPSPDAGAWNDQESLESFAARKERNMAKHCNGNGMGTPLAMRVRQSWPTPRAHDWKSGQTIADYGNSRPLCEAVTSGLPDPESPSTHGNRPEQWRTPSDPSKRGGAQPAEKRAEGGHTVNLEDQVMSWPTPRAEHDSGRHRGVTDTLHSAMKTAASGTLNPRWVEILMNLPVGWTMPSCASPVTPASMNSDCSETE